MTNSPRRSPDGIMIWAESGVRSWLSASSFSYAEMRAREIDKTSFEWTHRGVDAVDTRAGLLHTLDDLERTSLDYYAAIRSLYRQKRRDDILNGENDAPVLVPNISFDDEDEKKDAALKPIISFNGEDENKPSTPLGAQTSAKPK